jgi:hypothetical protein
MAFGGIVAIPAREQGSSLLFLTCQSCGQVIIACDEKGTLFPNSTDMEKPS